MNRGFVTCPTFGTGSRSPRFGGGGGSESTQFTTTKDNSALVESDGINVTDGASGVRDEGILASGKNSSVQKVSGLTFSGARKNSIEPLPAAMIGGSIIFAVYLFSKAR